jgi:hypothetical protein
MPAVGDEAAGLPPKIYDARGENRRSPYTAPAEVLQPGVF